MGQPISMYDLVSGIQLSPSQELYVLFGMEYQLDAELLWQNQLIYLEAASANEWDEDDMKEIKNLSSSLKTMMDGVKSAAADAQAQFQAEAERAKTNAGKVVSVAQDLKTSNLELEAFLGESDSNFPPS